MLEQLACAMNRNDEEPNIQLAIKLVENADKNGIKQLVDGLRNKDKAIANDCIKVLYEIGERQPTYIADYVDEFALLLTSKNNRLVWGAMTALAQISDLQPDKVYYHINTILQAYEKGSVITIDNSITVLAKLCHANHEYEKHIIPILIGHLANCRPKEIPQHAERMVICINDNNKNEFFQTLNIRFSEMSPAQQRRIVKIQKLLE